MNFKDLGINESYINILKKSGIKSSTPIQEQAIPYVLGQHDVIAEAQTGTGKTLAFLLPIFQNLDPKKEHTQALILTPTRELALQITEQANMLAKNSEINVLAAYGGRNIGSQLKKLRGPIHLIVATPGRLIDHITRKTIDLSAVNTVVIDEADQMLLLGFKNEVTSILSTTPHNRQTLCFSATMGSNVKRLASALTFEPKYVTIEAKTTAVSTIKQELVETTDRWKADALCQVLEEDNPFLAIIFCRTKRRADDLFAKMKKNKFNVQVIHSDIAQNKRERILKSFREADLQYLIATDVASRGLDISGVSHIYNFDVPETPETYIHRIGRTGRAGDDGYTCMFYAEKDFEELNQIERRLRFNIKRREVEFTRNRMTK